MRAERDHRPHGLENPRRTWRVLAARVGVAALIWVGCSPSYPIPPPAPDVASFQLTAPSAGRIRIDAANLAAATKLFVFNRNAGEGTIGEAGASGTVRVELPGVDGHQLEIYAEDGGGTRSESTCPVVNLSGPLLPVTCP